MTNSNRDKNRCVLEPRLCRELIREIRIASLLTSDATLPPPSDTDAEQDVVSAILWGTLAPRDLHPLRADHLIVPLFRDVLCAAEVLAAKNERIDPQAVARHLRELGANDGRLEEVLETLSCLPFSLPAEVRERAGRVIERARARGVCREIRSVDVLLRLGELRADDACSRLAALVASSGGQR